MRVGGLLGRRGKRRSAESPQQSRDEQSRKEQSRELESDASDAEGMFHETHFGNQEESEVWGQPGGECTAGPGARCRRDDTGVAEM